MAQGSDSFEAAFTHLFPVARRAAYRLSGNAALAEDHASEALARAYSRWRRLQHVEYLDAWVLRVAINLAIDSGRRKTPVLPGPANAPDPNLEPMILRLSLVAALARLPARQREVIGLRYLVDLREEDVASALGISQNSVKTHTQRGLANLRTFLNHTSLEELLNHV